MLQKTIHKDIDNYQEKIIGQMSLRKLLCASCAIGLGIGLSLLLGTCWDVDSTAAAYAGVCVTIPIWYLGWARPRGLDPEVYIPLKVDEYTRDKRLPYISLCTDLLETKAKEATKHADISKEQVKYERRLPEWCHVPLTRRNVKLRRKVWATKEQLAKEAAIAQRVQGD